MNDDAPLFTLFWENSKLNARTAPGFAERLDEDARAATQVAQLFHPGADRALVRPEDPLARVMARRASQRAFGPARLTDAQLGSLFYAFAHKSDAGRILPSAGAKYPIEVFALLFGERSIVYYNGDTHSLSVVGPAPSWDEVAPSVGLTVEGTPSALFVFAALPGRVTSRYGERGGRFLLLECGHHAQSLALRVAHENLKGVEAGGLHDETFKRWLRLERTDAVIPLGYAIGS